ncbi:N-6 DNA methylase [Pseudomonas agarici]|uniref:N-6 DNA methylase n=2 Tax=Pseudomonas agarici TaxID=46677 RepID=UPI0008AC0114|nr:N-6 DNA methylase [Pseudomonas agarici]NWC10746.1 N-6 DNA methylase [Pseudomonas agarici]SEL49458.1 type I restriction enzyme M protein [Pseudomonas agarici]
MPILSGSITDPLGRYYTKERISAALISALSVNNPELILDLGSGDGALSRAAYNRWAQALYITVDIDRHPLMGSDSANNSEIRHFHYLKDALSPSLIQDIGISPESVDIALCNPPFIKPKWRDEYKSILEQAGFATQLQAIKYASAEFIFIAQNLLSLKQGGQLGLIVPDGFVSGEKNKKLRELILQEHSIDSVIKLPRNVFVGTEAQAHILIITKNGDSSSPIKLQHLDSDSDTMLISAKEAVQTLDYSYYSAKSLQTLRSSTVTLSSIGCSISRGKLNSRQAREAQFDVLHTSDLRPGSTSLDLTTIGSNLNSPEDAVFATTGDILIARVGRDLEERVCIVSKGTLPITDCIYRIQAPKKWRRLILKQLTSKAGKAFLTSRAHGVSARHLPLKYLLDLPIQKD